MEVTLPSANRVASVLSDVSLLTAEQMSLLTEDMMWLVNPQVQLADGTWQTVMVPLVYARVKPGDMDSAVAPLGRQNVVMNLSSDLVNSGTINGREAVALSADNITNKAGTIQGADVSLQARTDINNIGGIISGNNSQASTGCDINVVTTTRSAQSASGKNSFERTSIERTGGTTHTETTVNAGNNLPINSGRDANLIGAQVSSESVTADIGRDLTIRSEQDSDSYYSKQQNVNARASFSFGSMSGSASVNASRDKMDSNYKSVNEQSGITAGLSGYDIKVGGHTWLDGAVIASPATHDKNRLDTGMLSWTEKRVRAKLAE
ncbi:hemagglutinin repeat-containing protein [Citrobacter amalonaticus]|uniref:hemagglutinin repeat-containing protein n=1 Tax=Citrobacter amalonaticus TaxID=35703 RepID=UPI001A25F208|nr:hypothetical protein [Citrobacter amalonaticus]HDQ2813320.1 hemagglutinin repeat-containing protein [Citrobacter amalonaticus]